MDHMPDLWKSDVADADVSKRTQRTMKLTEKGLQYRLEQLREKRGKPHGKLFKKFSVIDEMTYLCVSMLMQLGKRYISSMIPSSCLCQHMKNIKVYRLTKNKQQIVNGMTNLMRCLVLNTKCSSG